MHNEALQVEHFKQILKHVVLHWVEEVVALVADSDFIFLAAFYMHLPLRAGLTNQAAASPAVMPSVKLQTRTNIAFTNLTHTKDKTKVFHKHIEDLKIQEQAVRKNPSPC